VPALDRGHSSTISLTLRCERMVNMIEQARSYVSETCAWCSGSGKRTISIGHDISCLVCGGKGKVQVLQPSGPCRQCEGRGRRSVNAACLNCAGTGWARVFK
jgi:DnaJ-class molecular chaperone